MSPPSSSNVPAILDHVDDSAVFPGAAKSSAVELEIGDKAVIQHFHVAKPSVEQLLVTENSVPEDIPPPPPGGYRLYKRRWAGIAALVRLLPRHVQAKLTPICS